MITGLDHIQISIPSGRVPDALSFYVDLLGFQRVPKPAALSQLSQTGAWLVSSNEPGSVNLHLGETDNFVTDGNAHPAFKTTDAEALIQRLEAANCRTRRDAGPPGFIRASTWDPFGNRIEFMQRIN